MIDYSKALAAAAVLAVAAVLLAVGFVVGRSSADDDNPTDPVANAGNGFPAGPSEIEDGVPVGFARSEQGALAAGAAWVPWFLSSPAEERPEGIERVLAAGVEAPGGESLTTRFQFTPIALRVEMESDSRAVVTLVGPVLQGDLGEELTGEFWKVPVTLEWDENAGDWRIATFPTGTAADYLIDGPLDAADVAGFQALRSAGVIDGAPIVEEVPGD